MYIRKTNKSVTITTGTDDQGNPITQSVLLVNAYVDSAHGLTEQIVGDATFNVMFSDGNGTEYPDQARYVTTEVPDSLLAMFRRVVNGDSDQTEIDQVDQILLNSPEANALIPGADPATVPDVNGLFAALQQTALDPNSILDTQVLAFLPVFQPVILDTQIRQSTWAALKAKHASWLTSDMITLIEQIAAQYNLPLS